MAGGRPEHNVRNGGPFEFACALSDQTDLALHVGRPPVASASSEPALAGSRRKAGAAAISPAVPVASGALPG